MKTEVQEYEDMNDKILNLAYWTNSIVDSEWNTVFELMFKPDFEIEEWYFDVLTAFKEEVDAGLVPMLEKIDGEYVERATTIDDLLDTIKLNRFYTVDIIKDLLMKKRCPSDLHLYSDDFGGEDAN